LKSPIPNRGEGRGENKEKRKDLWFLSNLVLPKDWIHGKRMTST